MSTKIIFSDLVCQYPDRFAVTDLGDGISQIDASPGAISVQGTPLSADNLNAIADEVIFKLTDVSTSTTAYMASLTGFGVWSQGFTILFQPANTNTDKSTMSINNIVVPIRKVDNNGNILELEANDLIKNKYSILIFDGTELLLNDPSAELSALVTDIQNIQNTLGANGTDIANLKSETVKFAILQGSSNAYAASISTVDALYSGLEVNVIPNFSNTGASSLQINALNTIPMKFNGNDLVSGVLLQNKLYKFIYDGVNFNLQPSASQVDTLNTNLTSHLADNVHHINVADDTGVGNAYAIAPSPAIIAYAPYQTFKFRAKIANTGASTLNVDTLGVKNLVKNVNVPLVTGDILAGQIVTTVYDGTNFQLIPDYSLQLMALTNNLLSHEDDNMLRLDIKGTQQYPTMVGNQPTQILHKAGSVIIRTDTFTYSTNLITEVRVLASDNATVTFKYHLDTLETEVI